MTSRFAGLHVCADPDLVTYWLAGEIDDERGWGIRKTPSASPSGSGARGAGLVLARRPRSGDRVYRTHFLAEGGTLTAAQAQIAAALGARARVLPMSNDPVRTRVRTGAGWRGLQEFLILDRGEARSRR